MPGAEFFVTLTEVPDAQANMHGLEIVEFEVRTNPGQPAKALGKVASGGELSRLALAIMDRASWEFADLRSRVVLVALLMTFGYGFTGFLDDYLKLSKKNSKGLAGRYKMVLQTLFFGISIFGILTDWSSGTPHLLIDTRLTVPFVPTKWANPDLGWLYIFFAWVVVVGTSNAVNLTDGLDGLAIAPTVVSAVVFAVLCYVAGTSLAIADIAVVNGARQLVGVPVHEYLGIAKVDGGAELAIFCASIVGATRAPLLVNTV